MNNELQKKLVATHNQVDPSIVTAKDLVRAIKQGGFHPIWLAQSLGFKSNLNDNFDNTYYKAINYVANLITLPEDQPQTVKLTTGATVSYEQYKVVADYQDGDLPFSEPINGVEQDG